MGDLGIDIKGMIDGKYPMKSEYRVDYPNRIVPVIGHIQSGSLSHSILSMLRLDSENCGQPIILFIRSQGGDLEETLLLREVIDSIKSPVISVAFDACGSAGSLLFAAGKYRCCFEQTEFLVHKIKIDLEDSNEEDIKTTHQTIVSNNKFLLGMYAKASNKYIPWWVTKLKDSKGGDYIFGAKEAKRLDFVNGLIFNPKNPFNMETMLKKFYEFQKNEAANA